MSNITSVAQTLLPCWLSVSPERRTKNQKMKGDWSVITIDRLHANGKNVRYCMENSTGDLYWYEPRYTVAIKSFFIFIGTFFYIPALMVVNGFQILVDIYQIVWKVLSHLGKSLQDKGVMRTFFNMFFHFSWEIPTATMEDIWRIARAPIFGIGLAFAALYGIVFPYEGRVWIGKIEYELHQKTPSTLSCQIFLANCMQKKGNIEDKAGNVAKYRLVKDTVK